MSKQKPKYTLIKFLSRDASNYNTDKAIAKMKNSPLKRDVALVASNKKHVEAHAFVLMLFSPKFAELLENFDASNGRQLISMTDVPNDILEKAIELFYAGEVHVTDKQLPLMKQFLQSMRVPDLNIFEDDAVLDRFKQQSGISLTKVNPATTVTRVMSAPKLPPPQNPAKRSRSEIISTPVPLQRSASPAIQKMPNVGPRGAVNAKPMVPVKPPNQIKAMPVQTTSMVSNQSMQKIPAALQNLGCTIKSVKTSALTKPQATTEPMADDALNEENGSGNVIYSMNPVRRTRSASIAPNSCAPTPLNPSSKAPGYITPSMILAADIEYIQRPQPMVFDVNRSVLQPLNSGEQQSHQQQPQLDFASNEVPIKQERKSPDDQRSEANLTRKLTGDHRMTAIAFDKPEEKENQSPSALNDEVDNLLNEECIGYEEDMELCI